MFQCPTSSDVLVFIIGVYFRIVFQCPSLAGLLGLCSSLRYRLVFQPPISAGVPVSDIVWFSRRRYGLVLFQSPIQSEIFVSLRYRLVFDSAHIDNIQSIILLLGHSEVVSAMTQKLSIILSCRVGFTPRLYLNLPVRSSVIISMTSVVYRSHWVRFTRAGPHFSPRVHNCDIVNIVIQSRFHRLTEMKRRDNDY